MSDLASNEQPTICPQPSPISRGEVVTNHLERTDSLLIAADLSQAIAYQFGEMLIKAGVCDGWPIKVDSFKTDTGPRVKIDTRVKPYSVTPRPNTMGS